MKIKDKESEQIKKMKFNNYKNDKILYLILGDRKYNLDTEQYNLNESDTIYFCNDCLEQYGEDISYKRHIKKCKKFILGSHIVYKENNLVVYKLFGSNNIPVSQNLCILGKCFIKHKTLYWDIDNYNFYIMYDNNNLVGFFSDEMYNETNNLSCILVLPDSQKKGYGTLLVDLSYHFKQGTCERPLSEDGEILFKKYWKSKIYNYLKKNCGRKVSINKISEDLNMLSDDVIEGLKLLNCKLDVFLIIKGIEKTNSRFLNKNCIVD